MNIRKVRKKDITFRIITEKENNLEITTVKNKFRVHFEVEQNYRISLKSSEVRGLLNGDDPA